ncbi:Transcription-repair-coupling factor [bacterium HR29]|jgi:transcription-repair coupling factor (superfamily II helicase)|nr:Transcription-repair-coupling factor [bacterium HR29]
MAGPLFGIASHLLAHAGERLRVERRRAFGVPDAARPIVAAALAELEDGPVLWVVPTPAAAHAMEDEVALYVERVPVVRLPESERLPYELSGDDPASVERRDRALAVLGEGHRAIVIASWAALAEHCPGPETRSEPVRIRVGQRCSPPELAQRLEAAGYRIGPLAERPGEAARHGGVVDVFPVGGERPVRIEFFGDEVESIRAVDLATQRSVGRLEVAEFPPAGLATRSVQEAARELANRLAQAGPAAETILHELELIAEGGRSRYPGFFTALLSRSTALDFVPDSALVIVDDEREGYEALARTTEYFARVREERVRRGQLPPGLPDLLAGAEALRERLAAFARRADLLRFGTEELGVERLPVRPAPTFGGHVQRAVAEAARLARSGSRVVIASQQAVRLAELLEEERVPVALVRAVDDPSPGVVTATAAVASAGVVVGEDLWLFTDSELFGFRKQRRTVRRREAIRPELLADLEVGCYLVHAEHGIARFGGLVRRTIGGVEREYLELQYAEGDRLYVPTDQLDAVSRYIGPSDRPPTVTRLGTGEWAHTKRRVQRAVATMARDLLELYAKRQLAQGFAYPPDTPWQLEMEAAFPYVETPDQLAAIEDVKRDMESPRPMDRLICGDVGFGKTEVAIRAAFKAVMAGKQVAVLVPTTVLAEQHGRTFRERLAGFPVRIEVLSRFRSEAEQRAIVEATARGDVDILIGTHRILQKDVQFRDLGLLIVDEEQRFGVAQKEHLKKLRTEIDVLSLSATPIPRTLQMSLSGIRDMSTIMTPPEDRQPVRTYVTAWDDEIVREAIMRELQRGGQVYFVHNRVQSIGKVYERLRQLVPEARIAVGHGRMPEEKLERVMAEFAAGEHDVLLCTTIIESGLDIPNVNTIIIDQADKLGLAQLYQLRGRVGRSDRQAYAYLLYSPDRALSETAQRRLEAIFESQELGAGLQIALRDLEIRGAGNLLGTEQSGYIAAVGFELYSKLLAEAVEALRSAYAGAPAPPREQPPRPTVDLPLSAFVPESYVPDPHQRLAIYQRLARAETAADIAQLREEVRDRYGPLPEPVEHLLLLALVRVLAARAGVESVTADEEMVHVRVRGGVRPEQAARVKALGARCLLVGPNQVRIDLGLAGREWTTWLVRALRALAPEPRPSPVPA